MTLETIVVPGDGPKPCPIMLVGEWPGFDEVNHTPPKAFVGRSGRLLWHMLDKEWNLSRDSVYVTNLFKTMVDPKKLDAHRADAEAELRMELLEVSPSLVVTLGRNATRFMLGHDVNMEAVHGILYNVDPALDMESSRVLPCFNPAAALRNPDFLSFSAVDLKAGVKAAVKALQGLPMPPGRSIRQVFPVARYGMAGVVLRRVKALFIDTEGYPNRPWCLSLYDGGKEARVVLATDSVGLHIVQEYIDLADMVVLHNSMFDIGVLRAMGITIPDSKLHDSMVLAYNRKLEPQGLKNLVMRHYGWVMDEYEDIEGPFAEFKAQTYLARAAEIDWGKADPVLEEKNGILNIKQPQSINAKILKMFHKRDKGESTVEEGAEGTSDSNDVSFRKWWYKNVDYGTRRRIESKLGRMPDFTFDDVPPSIALQYAGLDAIATCGVWEPLVKQADIPNSYRIDMDSIPMFERMQSNGMAVNVAHFRALEEDLTQRMLKLSWDISHKYNKGVWFNPNSGDQVAKLLFDQLGLRSNKMTKSQKRLATDDKVLEALRNDHPIVANVIDYRELATMRDKFAKQIPIRVGEDGRVRGRIRTTRTETGRPSMSDPNLLAIPVRSDWGKLIRDGFVAPEGRKLGSCDLNQIELRVMAHRSGDANMIRLFNEGVDLHSWVASRMFGIPVKDLDPMLHRYPAKRVGFGVATGIQAEGLLDQMKLAGIHSYKVDDCDRFIKSWLEQFSGFHAYMHHMRREARQKGYVTDMWGRIRYLPGASCPFPGIRNEAERQSHSHDIQGSAAGIMRIAMKTIWDIMPDLWNQGIYFEPLIQIYDDFISEFDPKYEELVSSIVEWAMTRSVELAVPITAKFKSGYTWGSIA